MQPKNNDAFYVGIKDPISIRKTLLESVKQIVQAEQKFEQYKETRLRKLEEVTKLKENIKEINMLITKLKGELPNTMLRAISESEKHKEISRHVPTRSSTPKTRSSELAELENELNEVESKISKIRKK